MKIDTGCIKCRGSNFCKSSIEDCKCESPWFGELCDKLDKDKVHECSKSKKPCSNHGKCHFEAGCKCFDGYEGKDCEIIKQACLKDKKPCSL